MLKAIITSAVCLTLATGPALAATITLGGTAVPGQGRVTNETGTTSKDFSSGAIPADLIVVAQEGIVTVGSGSIPNVRLAPEGVDGSYLSIGHGSVTFDLGPNPVGYFGIDVGSLDEYGVIQFYAAGQNSSPDAAIAGDTGMPESNLPIGEAIFFVGCGALLTGQILRDCIGAILYTTLFINFYFLGTENVRFLRVGSIDNNAIELNRFAQRDASIDRAIVIDPAQQVPAPGGLALAALGLAGVFGMRRRAIITA